MSDMADLIDKAALRLGHEHRAVFEYLANQSMSGLDWYIQRKILAAYDERESRDHLRVLKYALNFSLKGGLVTFVPEGSGRAPDLRVDIEDKRFYVEVKNLRMPEGEASAHPVEKMVTAIESKRSQLPDSEIGFVAIGNFDIYLEPEFGHHLIADALCEVGRRAEANPGGWQKPSGVIVSASTTSGTQLPIEIPIFVWTNAEANPPCSDRLAAWVCSSLPSGRRFDPAMKFAKQTR